MADKYSRHFWGQGPSTLLDWDSVPEKVGSIKLRSILVAHRCNFLVLFLIWFPFLTCIVDTKLFSSKQDSTRALQKDPFKIGILGQKLTMHITIQGQLQIWTEHSTLIFENLKPAEKSKKSFLYHLNIFNSCIDFQNQVSQAQKFSLPRSFQF